VVARVSRSLRPTTVPEDRRPISKSKVLRVSGATGNNLKGVTVGAKSGLAFDQKLETPLRPLALLCFLQQAGIGGGKLGRALKHSRFELLLALAQRAFDQLAAFDCFLRRAAEPPSRWTRRVAVSVPRPRPADGVGAAVARRRDGYQARGDTRMRWPCLPLGFLSLSSLHAL